MRLDFAKQDSDIIAKMNGSFVERPRRPTGELTSKAKKSKKPKAGGPGAGAGVGISPPVGGGGGGGPMHNVDNAPPNQILFLTNLLAIALSITVLSRLYGFGANHGSRSTMWQSAMVLAVFAALSLPLGIALRDIAYEATAINTVKDALLDPFDDN